MFGGRNIRRAITIGISLLFIFSAISITSTKSVNADYGNEFTSPGDNVQWTIGDTHEITWTYGTIGTLWHSTEIVLLYSGWGIPETQLFSTNDIHVRNFAWTIPVNQVPGTYEMEMRFTLTDGRTLTAESTTFSINVVLSGEHFLKPSQAGSLYLGNTYDVSWEYGAIGTLWRSTSIVLKSDAGSVELFKTTDIKLTNFNWKIPIYQTPGVYSLEMWLNLKDGRSLKTTWIGISIIMPHFDDFGIITPNDGAFLRPNTVCHITWQTGTLGTLWTGTEIILYNPTTKTTQSLCLKTDVLDRAFDWTPSSRLATGLYYLATQLNINGRDPAIMDMTSINIDNTPPKISYIQSNKIDPIKISDLSFSFSDVGAGIDSNRFMIKIDGIDVTSNAAVAESSLKYPTSLLSYGKHTVIVTVYDLVGNMASLNLNIQVVKSNR